MHIPGAKICVLAVAISQLASGQQNIDEYQVKAAYLYSIAKATHWPAGRLPPKAALIIGVSGGDEDFLSVLRNILAAKTIQGHPLEVRRVRFPDELKFCHLIFFRSPDSTPQALITQLGKNSVLSVGEDKDFLDQGGMINLQLANGKIMYVINERAITRAGLNYAADERAEPAESHAAVDARSGASRGLAVRVLPEYPRIARELNLAGSVHLRILVRPDGSISEVNVVGGHPVLAEAAVAAVKQWRYQAAARQTSESVRVSFGPQH